MIYPGAPPVRSLGSPARAERVSKARSRVYGAMSVAMGMAIAWVTVRYGRR